MWQLQAVVYFTPNDLKEAGQELVSAAQLIRDLDCGRRYPVRIGLPHVCRSCRFEPICQHPEDRLFVDSIFERTQPKRLREPVMA